MEHYFALPLKLKIMKRVLLAAFLGLGVISFTMAGGNHMTAPTNQLTKDTVPSDTVPSPRPDSTHFNINH
ncbi:MAG: hypothetical protein J7497_08545 [Chitinophagaceae bacterium]|nr:hypothetical protein [Chitinophagaceae bacterium]